MTRVAPSIEKLDAPLGAVVRGIDVRQPLATEQVDALHTALFEHQGTGHGAQPGAAQRFGQLQAIEADLLGECPYVGTDVTRALVLALPAAEMFRSEAAGRLAPATRSPARWVAWRVSGSCHARVGRG